MAGDITKGRIVPEFTAADLSEAPTQAAQWNAYKLGCMSAIHKRSKFDYPFAVRGNRILEHQFRTGFDEVEPQIRDKDAATYEHIKDLAQHFGLKGFKI